MTHPYIGTNLRTARRLRGWTQAELAARAGVSRRAVIRAERGLVSRLPILSRIAAALGCDLGVLLRFQPADREHARQDRQGRITRDGAKSIQQQRVGARTAT